MEVSYDLECGESLKTEGSEMGDYSVALSLSNVADIHEEDEHAEWTRQNSVNEEREHGKLISKRFDATTRNTESASLTLADKNSLIDDSKDKEKRTRKTHGASAHRQKSSSPKVETVLHMCSNCDRSETHLLHSKTDYYHQRDSTESAKSEQKGWKRRSKSRCQCFIGSCSLLALVMSTMMLIYLVYRRNMDKGSIELPLVQPSAQVSAFTHDKGEGIMARFHLNQTAFISNNKTSLVWSPVGNKESKITLNGSSCLVVPERGTYGLFSKLTFRIENTDNTRKIGHYFQLEGYQDGELPHQRQITELPMKEMIENELIISSTFQSFIAMEKNGTICILANPTDHIFISPLDNTVNIFKY